MGDPRKIRKKYKGPSHPWQAVRIIEERGVKRNYGLKNKKEIWKVSSELKRVKSQAKNLIREKGKENKQAFLEEKQLLKRLAKYGWMAEDSSLDTVLTLKLKDLLDRRLQTLVHKQGLSLTAKQARQFIVHGHIYVNSRKVTIPSYLVDIAEASTIQFNPGSTLNDAEHPERAKEKKIRDAVELKKVAENKVEEVKTVEDLTEADLEKIEKEIVAEVPE